jgi:hypothetical protein
MILIKKYFPYILSIILLILLLEECSNHQKTVSRHQQNATALTDTVKYYRLLNKQIAAEKAALSVTQKELKKQLWIKDDSLKVLVKNYKKPMVVTKVEQKTKLDTIRIPFKKSDSSFTKTTPYYSISGFISDDVISFDTFELNNTQRLVTGYKKGFFSHRLTTTITNSNPYVQTRDIATQVVEIKRKRFGLSVFAGMGILGKPAIGIGLTYDILQF